MRRRLFPALVLTMLLLVRPASAQEDDVLVFAAASLKNAMDEITSAYTEASGAGARTSLAASSTLAKQIESGAPADIFFSADLDWMDYLAQRDLIAVETQTELLRNQIVLVAPAGSAIEAVRIGPDLDLTALIGDGRLAVADVRAVPAGKYAKAALEKLGAWSGVEDRLAQAENVRAALALVSRGEAPLGIVYATDARVDGGVKVVGAFPEGSHPPIVYPVAVTNLGAEGTAAGRFLAFLKGGTARAVFERQGFTVVGAEGG